MMDFNIVYELEPKFSKTLKSNFQKLNLAIVNSCFSFGYSKNLCCFLLVFFLLFVFPSPWILTHTIFIFFTTSSPHPYPLLTFIIWNTYEKPLCAPLLPYACIPTYTLCARVPPTHTYACPYAHSPLPIHKIGKGRFKVCFHWSFSFSWLFSSGV